MSAKKNDEKKPEIAFFTTEELMAEISVRFDTIVIGYIDGHKDNIVWWRGDHLRCLGVTEVIKQTVFMNMD